VELLELQTDHSRIAVDTWEWDKKNEKWIKTGTITFELGTEGGAGLSSTSGTTETNTSGASGASKDDAGWLNQVGMIASFFGPGYASVKVNKTDGLYIYSKRTQKDKYYETIMSTPEEDLKLLEDLQSVQGENLNYHAWIRNCHTWVDAHRYDGMDR
jgi:hypothetical protein